MSKKTEAAIVAALKSLHDDVEDLRKNDERQEKVQASQGMAIAELQQEMMTMRNRAIAAEAKSRVPYKEITQKYGVSAGRISQIKKEYN
jgi:DNA-directed RNA polymerase specialized sigma subunit